jgi:uncharacterized Tic20 family protein
MYSHVYHKDIFSLTQNRKARAACPKCGVEQTPLKKEVSSLWYLVPFFFGIFGGLIAWIVNNDRNPKKARNFLIFGLVWGIIEVVVIAFFWYIILAILARVVDLIRSTWYFPI